MFDIFNLQSLAVGLFLGIAFMFFLGWLRNRNELGDIHIEVSPNLKEVNIRLPDLKGFNGISEEDRRRARLILASAINKLSRAIQNLENGFRYEYTM